MKQPEASGSRVLGWIFRAALFFAAASLAAYVPYKYATQLHAISGMYAFLFPLSGLLALAGIVVACKPETACDCGVPMRAGVGAIAITWMVTGLMCVKSLAAGFMDDPLQGTIATFHMTVQHVFLSLSLLAFAFLPERMVQLLGRMSPPARGERLTGHQRPA